MVPDLLTLTDRGLYSPQGDFYIDPWRPVARAIVTHAHSDHARPGSEAYLTAQPGADLVRERVGPEAIIEALPYGESLDIQGIHVSLHPAGHILGSAQVRLEHAGQVWVVTGDYKTAPDATCQPFEPLRCHTLVTESTFGLPIFRWRTSEQLFQEINDWWQTSQERGRTCMLYCYALGKAQRILTGLDGPIGPILVHGAVERFLDSYQRPCTLPSIQRRERQRKFRRWRLILPVHLRPTPPGRSTFSPAEKSSAPSILAYCVSGPPSKPECPFGS